MMYSAQHLLPSPLYCLVSAHDRPCGFLSCNFCIWTLACTAHTDSVTFYTLCSSHIGLLLVRRFYALHALGKEVKCQTV